MTSAPSWGALTHRRDMGNGTGGVVPAIVFANGMFASVASKCGRTDAGWRSDGGRVGAGSLTGAAVETNQLLALLTTISFEFIFAFAKWSFLLNGAIASVHAITFTRVFVFQLTAISFKHEGAFAHGLVSRVDRT